MRRLILVLAMGGLGVAAISNMAGSAVAATTLTVRHSATHPTMSVLPLSIATTRRLPPGTFYLLAGPNGISYDVWQVNHTGLERHLTHTKPNFGISGFTASQAGLVLSNAPGGVDVLVRYTSHGLVPINAGSGERATDAGIDSRGRLVIVTVPNSAHNYFLIGTTRSISSRPTWVSRAPVSYAPFTPQWGPDGQISVVIGPNAPSVANKPYRLMIVHGTKSYFVGTGFKSVANAVWQDNSHLLAVESSKLQGEVMTLAGSRQALPRGWFGLAWSPNAKQLLVRSGRQLGVWSPSSASRVSIIGAMNLGSWVVQASWLAAPAAI